MELLKNLDELLSTSSIFNDCDIDKLDLSKEEDYQKVVSFIKECKDNTLFSLVGSLFGIDDELLDNVLENVEKEHNKLVQENKENDELKQEVIERPSQKIDTQVGLQIHQLVQEYVDTMIKPYNPKNGLSTEQINDAYAGLFEYSCWLFSHK